MSAPDPRPLSPEDEQTASHDGQEERLQALEDDYLGRLRDGDSPDPYELMLLHLPITQEVEERLEMAALLHRYATRGAGAETSQGGASVPTMRSPGRAAHTAVGAELPPGTPTRIGRYEVRKVLGAGATGVVYEAFDPLLQRPVALKVLRQDRPAGGGAVHVLDRDARIAAGLRHPNIVPVYETADDGGLRYVVMALIDGETLEARLKRGTPPADEAVELARKLASALAYAHESGVVHRDVKPANVLLWRREGKPDEPHLTDFGLARLADGENSISQGILVVGTWAYMPPEQARGDGSQADGRSDVYSLGVVLYRMLTGRLPFEADTAAGWLARIEGATPPAPRAVNPSVPRDLEAICLKAMAREPGRRFATARDFAEELGRWQRGEPLKTRPPQLWEVLWLWARRNRATAWTAGVAAGLLLVVSTVLGGFAWVKDREAQRKRRDAVAADTKRIIETRNRAVADSHLVLGRARQRLAVPTQGRREEAQEVLRLLRNTRPDIVEGKESERIDREARSVFVATLGVPELRVLREAALPNNAFDVWPPAIHPDGESLVVGLGDPPRPVRWKVSEPLNVPEGVTASVVRHRVTFSADGKSLALMPAAGRLEVWDGDLTRNVDLDPTGKARYLAVAFDPAGKAVCGCRADGEVRCWSLPDGKETTAWKADGKAKSALTAAAFNADGTLLVVATESGDCRLRRPAGTSEALAAVKAAVTALALSPDGRLVAVGTRDGDVEVWQRGDRDAGPVRLYRLPLANVEISSLVFEPLGHYLLAGARQTLGVWDVMTGERVLTGPMPAWGFARDGRRFAAGSLTGMALCELSPPEALRRLSGHPLPVDKTYWARDNRHMVSLDNRFGMRVWDVTAGRLVNELTGPRGSFWAPNAAVALSDDGSQLAYASGGIASRVVLWDVKSGKKLGDWPLPRTGFERLAGAGDSRFLLVREEQKQAGSPGVRTAAYEVAAGQAPREVREVRPAVEGEASFFDSGLTPDGRYYWWSGPRAPEKSYRVEVREVATGRLVTQVPVRPGKKVDSLGGVALSPDGRFLWAPRDDEGNDRHDLSGKEARVPHAPLSLVSAELRWSVRDVATEENGGATTLGLWRGSAEGPWLELENADKSGLTAMSFSRDGRYLAWGSSRSGVVTVADLKALEPLVTAFEKELRAK